MSMDARQRIEQLSQQRALLVQRREALAEQLKEAEDGILRMDGALLAYQEMADAEDNAEDTTGAHA